MLNQTRSVTASFGAHQPFSRLVCALAGWLMLTFTGCQPPSVQDDARPYNVLFITVDDLRPQLGCYGDSTVKSPQLDALSARSYTFVNAFCQQALCGPSRASFLTGYRPETLGIFDIQTHFRDVAPGVITLPQLFKQNGYQTAGLYKVFHMVGFDPAVFGNLDDTASWTSPQWIPHRSAWGPQGEALYQRSKNACLAKGALGYDNIPRSLAFEAPDVADSLLSDGEAALKAIEVIREFGDQPFFLAVGFYKPHLPFVAPRKYWDLYDTALLKLPDNQYAPSDAPAYALADSKELRSYTNIPVEGEFSTALKKNLLQGYLASISYVDAQIGMILRSLEEQRLADRTIVVVLGDHGFQVGEHNLWAKKHTNYETAVHTPLIVHVPGHPGKRMEGLVELIDVYPTLASLCGLTPPADLEGINLEPHLAQEGSAEIKKIVYSVFPRNVPGIGRCLGIAARTKRYRVVEWAVPEQDFQVFEMYDHFDDPGENRNVASAPEQREALNAIAVQLSAHRKTISERTENINKAL